MTYEFTGETIESYGHTLRQIRATSARPKYGIDVGDIGGWIEKESNFPQDSTGWIYPQAKVCGLAEMHGGEMHGGTMHGGEMRGGTMWGGEMRGGEMRGGTMHGGEMWGGEMWGGEMWGGEMHGGEMRGGTMWGGEMSKDAIFIAGLRWLIFINNNQMTIGCQSHDLKKWWKYCDATIAKMDQHALEFWHANKPMLQALCAATGRPSGKESN